MKLFKHSNRELGKHHKKEVMSKKIVRSYDFQDLRESLTGILYEEKYQPIFKN